MGNHHIQSLVFQPPAVTHYTDVSRGLPAYLTLYTSHGHPLPAFYIDHQAKTTLLFSHGNAEDLGMIYDWLSRVAVALHVNVFAYEYEGYGRERSFHHISATTAVSSTVPTTPSERCCYEDILTAYEYLVHVIGTPAEQIVLYGRSLGTGPSLYLAEKCASEQVTLGGIVLQVSSTCILILMVVVKGLSDDVLLVE